MDCLGGVCNCGIPIGGEFCFKVVDVDRHRNGTPPVSNASSCFVDIKSIFQGF